MSRDQIIADALAAIQSGQAQVLQGAVSAAVDASAQEQKGADGTLSQADLDAAVASAKAEDAQAMADAKAVSDAALLDLQGKLDALGAKEGQEAGVISGLQSSVAALRSSLDAIAALLPQVPA